MCVCVLCVGGGSPGGDSVVDVLNKGKENLQQVQLFRGEALHHSGVAACVRACVCVSA